MNLSGNGRQVLVGETDWVFVDAKTGRPLLIPEEVSDVFGLSQER
jgi:acyl-CoA thioesterase FadM